MEKVFGLSELCLCVHMLEEMVASVSSCLSENDSSVVRPKKPSTFTISYQERGITRCDCQTHTHTQNSANGPSIKPSSSYSQ